MALLQGPKGRRGSTAINPCEAGVVACVVMPFDLTTQAYIAGDVIELGPLPAFAQLVDAVIVGEGLGAVTATVGLLTGEAGDGSRAAALVGAPTNIFTAQSVNDTEAEATTKACLGIPVDRTADRAWGATISAGVAAGAGKKLTLVAFYTY